MNHDNQIAQMQNIIEEHNTRIAGLELALATANGSLNTMTELVTARSHRSRPKPSLPDPVKFNGTEMAWEQWHPAIRAKLRIDGESIGDGEAQFFYIYDRLEPKIQALVMPQLSQAEDDAFYDPAALIDQLQRLHDDPNKVQIAEDKLQYTKQGDDSLTTYLAKFERLLYKAKANLWSDSAKIALLRKGLNARTRARLDHQIIVPTDYNGFVTLLQKLGSPGSYNGGQSNNHTNNHSTPMELNELSGLDLAVKPFEPVNDNNNNNNIAPGGREYLTLAELKAWKRDIDREFINDLSE